MIIISKNISLIIVLIFGFTSTIFGQMKSDSTSCFLMMEVISYGNQGIYLYYGNGSTEHITLQEDVEIKDKKSKNPYYQKYGKLVAMTLNNLLVNGWKFVEVVHNSDPEDSVGNKVPRYYYFIREDCE